MTSLHPSAFDYMKPTDDQLEKMMVLRESAKLYASTLEHLLPEGPDKTLILRNHRINTIWVNVALTRSADGSPRA